MDQFLCATWSVEGVFVSLPLHCHSESAAEVLQQALKSDLAAVSRPQTWQPPRFQQGGGETFQLGAPGQHDLKRKIGYALRIHRLSPPGSATAVGPFKPGNQETTLHAPQHRLTDNLWPQHLGEMRIAGECASQVLHESRLLALPPQVIRSVREKRFSVDRGLPDSRPLVALDLREQGTRRPWQLERL